MLLKLRFKRVGAAWSEDSRGAGMAVALVFGANRKLLSRGNTDDMREMANGFAQLAAIVMILITLALSTAAVAQWADAPAASERDAPRALQVAAASSP